VAELPKEVAPPPKPAVKVGAFADDATAVRKPERVADVATTNFDNAAATATRVKRDVQTLDVFDTAPARSATRATVSDAGFGATAAAPAPSRAALTTSAAGFATDTTTRPAATPSRTTSAAGFAADAPVRTPAAAAKSATPQAAGFTETAAAPKPVPQAPPPPRADRPVEVVYKPSPAYTDEARAQRVEGEVTLEVEFTAAGQVRVLRVVRGLGHGLDEMAQRAAEQIRFKPATSKGTPVDFRATLTIVFRLT
jgi:TonB family protein